MSMKYIPALLTLLQQAKDEGKDVNVQDIMDTWILQQNYPVVMVTFDNTHIRATQSRYVLGNVSEGTASEFKQVSFFRMHIISYFSLFVCLCGYVI